MQQPDYHTDGIDTRTLRNFSDLEIEVQLANINRIQSCLGDLEANLGNLNTASPDMLCGELCCSQKIGLREPSVGWDDRIYCPDNDVEEMIGSINLDTAHNCTASIKSSSSPIVRVHRAWSRLPRDASSHKACDENEAGSDITQEYQNCIFVAGKEGSRLFSESAKPYVCTMGTRGGLVRRRKSEVASRLCQKSDELLSLRTTRQKQLAEQLHEQDCFLGNPFVVTPDQTVVHMMARSVTMERQRCFRGLTWTTSLAASGNSSSAEGKPRQNVKNGLAADNNTGTKVKATSHKPVASIDNVVCYKSV